MYLLKCSKHLRKCTNIECFTFIRFWKTSNNAIKYAGLLESEGVCPPYSFWQISSGFLIFNTSVQTCLYEKLPLKSKSMSPTLTPTEFSTLTYYHQFAHRLEIHLYSDKTVDTWDSNRHEFAKTWHFKHTDPEKILYRMFHIGKNIYCFILRYNGVVSSLKVHSIQTTLTISFTDRIGKFSNHKKYWLVNLIGKVVW